MEPKNRASVQRHTGPLIGDPAARAKVEARNALLQFDAVRALIRERGSDLRLTPEDVCGLQGIAVRGIFACAGKFRSDGISISNTAHCPPEPEEVPRLVGDMCSQANALLGNAYKASAYLMWRLNWIHPFADGNGRTSRAVSYLALCCGIGMELPGTVTVPDLIVQDKLPYYDALDQADAAWKNGLLDVSKMESLIIDLLTKQLLTSV